MKHICRLLLFLVLATSVFAQWSALRVGMTQNEVREKCGYPMVIDRSKGHETWVYDNGGQAVFGNGILLFFTAPKKCRGLPGQNQ